MNLLKTLNNFSFQKLKEVADEHPYSSIIQMVLAKKALIQENNADEFIAKASLRLPNRILLKHFLENESFTDSEAAATNQLSAESIQNEEHQASHKVTDESRLPELEENGEQVIVDQSEEQKEETVATETEEIAGDQLIIEQTDQKEEFAFDHPKKSVVKKKEVTFHGFDDDHVEPIGKHLVDAGEDDHEQEEDNSHLEGDNRQKIDPKDELAHDDYKIRLNIGSEEDHSSSISKELVPDEEHEEEVLNTGDDHTDDYLTVADIKKSGDDSVYKKVVGILKKDREEQDFYGEQDHIVESKEQDFPVDDFHQGKQYSITANEKPGTNEPIIDELESKRADEELEELYAKAAYEAEMTQQMTDEPEQKDIESDQRPENETNRPENQQTDKPPNDFIGWLNKFSRTGEKSEESVRQSSTMKQEPSVERNDNKDLNPKGASRQKDLISKEVENEYRDSEEDLDDETTREVQKMAQKSMSKDDSFYTETLAYIYEKQEKWKKAIEVYQALQLKNPEKSSYFANQIKKLEEKTD